jgi:hypothetical protein
LRHHGIVIDHPRQVLVGSVSRRAWLMGHPSRLNVDTGQIGAVSLAQHGQYAVSGLIKAQGCGKDLGIGAKAWIKTPTQRCQALFPVSG